MTPSAMPALKLGWVRWHLGSDDVPIFAAAGSLFHAGDMPACMSEQDAGHHAWQLKGCGACTVGFDACTACIAGCVAEELLPPGQPLVYFDHFAVLCLYSSVLVGVCGPRCKCVLSCCGLHQSCLPYSTPCHHHCACTPWPAAWSEDSCCALQHGLWSYCSPTATSGRCRSTAMRRAGSTSPPWQACCSASPLALSWRCCSSGPAAKVSQSGLRMLGHRWSSSDQEVPVYECSTCPAYCLRLSC